MPRHGQRKAGAPQTTGPERQTRRICRCAQAGTKSVSGFEPAGLKADLGASALCLVAVSFGQLCCCEANAGISVRLQCGWCCEAALRKLHGSSTHNLGIHQPTQAILATPMHEMQSISARIAGSCIKAALTGLPTGLHAYMYAQTFEQTRMHLGTHTNLHAQRMHLGTHTNLHAQRMHLGTHTNVHAQCMHLGTHTNVHAQRMHLGTHTNVHAQCMHGVAYLEMDKTEML